MSDEYAVVAQVEPLWVVDLNDRGDAPCWRIQGWRVRTDGSGIPVPFVLDGLGPRLLPLRPRITRGLGTTPERAAEAAWEAAPRRQKAKINAYLDALEAQDGAQ